MRNLRGQVLRRFPNIGKNIRETVFVAGREGTLEIEKVRVGDGGQERLGELLACCEFRKFKQILATVE